MTQPRPGDGLTPAPAAAVTTHPHDQPRTYPLMLRTWTYEWWRPLLGLLTLYVGMLLVAPVVLMPVLAAAVGIQGGAGSFADRFADALALKTVTPASMLYLNLTLASLVLVTWIIVRLVHRLRPRWLGSVRPGIRWRFLSACFGLAVVAVAAQLLLGLVLPTNGNEIGGPVHHLDGTQVALGIVILLSTPLQAIGEEYAFRGYTMQAVGSLTRSPWIAVVVSAVIFAIAHGGQNVPLFFDRLAFGLMAGYVVVRTGGLEAGIALHILNNLGAFGFALFFDDIDSVLNVSQVSWWNLPLTVTQNGVYLVLVLLVAKRTGIRDRSAPPVLAGH